MFCAILFHFVRKYFALRNQQRFLQALNSFCREIFSFARKYFALQQHKSVLHGFNLFCNSSFFIEQIETGIAIIHLILRRSGLCSVKIMGPPAKQLPLHLLIYYSAKSNLLWFVFNMLPR
jgi:hypothetical protein